MTTENKDEVIVSAIECPECGETIYSRAHHDFHFCHCGACAIDGGFDYVKITAQNPSSVQIKKIPIKATRKILYDDWNKSKNKYGWIKPKKELKNEVQVNSR